jgi:hypothetical protein
LLGFIGRPGLLAVAERRIGNPDFFREIVLDSLIVEDDRRKFRIRKRLTIQVGLAYIIELKILIWHNLSPIIVYDLRSLGFARDKLKVVAVAPA